MKVSIPFYNVAELTEVAQIDVTVCFYSGPSMGEIEVMAKVEGSRSTGTWLLKGRNSKGLSIEVARALVCPSSQYAPVDLMNP